MIHITKYIEERHQNNKADFARMIGASRQLVNYWCKGDYYIHDDRLYHLTRTIGFL